MWLSSASYFHKIRYFRNIFLEPQNSLCIFHSIEVLVGLNSLPFVIYHGEFVFVVLGFFFLFCFVFIEV